MPVSVVLAICSMLGTNVSLGNKFNVPIEGWHTESGPGVYEAALQYSEVKAMADKAGLFKYGSTRLTQSSHGGSLTRIQIRSKMCREQVWHYAMLYGKAKRGTPW